MHSYLALVEQILTHGTRKADRTGTGTLSVFGHQMRHDLRQGFPLLTTKKLHTKSIFTELLWFLRGDTNIRWLQEQGVTIWDEWADENGELGPVYGKQWRAWAGADGTVHDQIAQLIDDLRRNPDSRRHIVSAWNVADVPHMALPPCHLLQQYYVANGRLSVQVYQRSADIGLGLPFNLASYALLLHMLAQQTGYQPGELVYTLGDAHIYLNHIDALREQLTRAPRPLPRLELRQAASLFAYDNSDIVITDYHPHPPIRMNVSV